MHLKAASLLLSFALWTATGIHADESWPPELPGAKNGTVTIKTDEFLQVPELVDTARQEAGAAPFDLAKTPPTVHLAYHADLGADAVNRRLWSSWGDICVADDGMVYSGIGDHGNAVGGDARCFIYRWDPKQKVLEQIVDVNQIVPRQDGQPAWSKMHARIDEGADGKIYFCATLNDGNRAKLPEYKWNADVPGGQLYQYDPATGKATVFANLPARRCTATSVLDRRRSIWWCNLEAGEGNALWGLSLETKRPVFQSPDGTIAFNRNFALAADGSIYFNGEGELWRFDPQEKSLTATKSTFGDSPGIRCSTRESRKGSIYGVTHRTTQLFRYKPADDELTLLGPNWLIGSYTTVCVLSPDERFVYYLPGSHGGAFRDGTPVVQYDIATGRRKVLAFLAPAMERDLGYVPAGSYGVKMSADGGTIFVNFNGHAADGKRPEKMRPNGFGLCSFAAIEVPAGER